MLYCFDVDGTLIRSFMREGVERTPENYMKVEMLPRRREKLATLRHLRTLPHFALVTNQGGVAMGYQTPGEVRGKMGRVLAECEFFHGRPISVHIAMHHPKARLPAWQEHPGIERRKPSPGMIYEAMMAHDVPRRKTIMVGDMDADEEAATAAGVGFMHADEFFS